MTEDDIALGPGLTRAKRSQADHVADITADAFRNDLFNLWLFGKFAGIAATFRLLARHQYTPTGYTYFSDDEGACMWMLPDSSAELPMTVMPTILWNALTKTTRGGMKRINRTIAAMEANHPAFPHAYLFTIGVRPSAQGKGLGRKLIQPVLDACDRIGMPAYLENSNPANCGFYASCGFERVKLIHPMDGSPPLEAMLRQPR